MSNKDVLKLIKDEDVAYVDIRFTDPRGKLQHVTVVADLVDDGATHEQAAERLGITQSAVSQRAQAAGLVEGERARALVAHLAAQSLDAARAGGAR